ncbi:DNA-binding protein [Curtobacterium sp. MCSS17_005]|uniref:DNA-binding protein n=1 Tax=Curtobacterium sp. MCSS17_005 TaxID=2175641 RepID=UPI000DA8478D|nr:DNA-binding protein [Curtobacterium sp. MCSS17_005]WIB34431.1 DNA-binding protein [Curtobacterium sp. MCSS17_005]
MATTTPEYIDLATAGTRSDMSTSLLRYYIRTSRLPAVKIRGKVHVAQADLDEFLAPKPLRVDDGTLRAWAEKVAAKAPPLRPEQVDLIVSTFSSVLKGK